MSNVILIFVALVGSLTAYTVLPEQTKKIFGESIMLSQQIATAGDLRSMSVMLDAHYFTWGRYPAEDDFEDWLADTFKGSNLKDMAEDHWGNPYLYTVSKKGKAYLLRSVGPDSIADTDDDMTINGP